MARKRNEEYTGDSDGEFEEEPVESFEDPEDFVDEISDEGKKNEKRKFVIATYSKCVMKIRFLLNTKTFYKLK